MCVVKKSKPLNMVWKEVNRLMEKLFFDYSKLAGRIREKFGTQKAFAKKLGISEGSLSLKMTNYTYFSQAEIRKAMQLLELDPGMITDYFFTPKVKKTKQKGAIGTWVT